MPAPKDTPKTIERVHMKDAPKGTRCDIHEWPTQGLAQRLIEAMRARHLTGGINACFPCITRAKQEAHASAEAKKEQKRAERRRQKQARRKNR